MGLNLLEESSNGKKTRKPVFIVTFQLILLFLIYITVKIISYNKLINKLSHDWLGDIRRKTAKIG